MPAPNERNELRETTELEMKSMMIDRQKLVHLELYGMNGLHFLGAIQSKKNLASLVQTIKLHINRPIPLHSNTFIGFTNVYKIEVGTLFAKNLETVRMVHYSCPDLTDFKLSIAYGIDKQLVREAMPNVNVEFNRVI